MPLNPLMLTEKEIIDGCKAGKSNAQKALFLKYGPIMLSVCRRYARHQMEAEDFVQDGFIKVFRHIDKFKEESKLGTWIRRIMINNALKHVSKSAFKRESIGIADNYDQDIDAGTYAKLSAEEIMKLVNELPTGYKIVFNLYAIEGYSHKEIAEQLEIGESTSRSQLLKARRMLQEKFIELQKIAV
ncbi:DNA-directed RNA polymerase sigma-70 factor [Portibacter lacus]|uniref:DNA-directed RNA polymerase sigma-70 factor n=2 Tax=Portibacter lacus TaxID=1099794 RepID=A0AA37SP70_9BACT|nr:DNA-directed RNA polymerase sigma-70 factor [Portibacter lacus]